MTITVESHISKVGGKQGVKLEQQYLIGENGLELMSYHLYMIYVKMTQENLILISFNYFITNI